MSRNIFVLLCLILAQTMVQVDQHTTIKMSPFAPPSIYNYTPGSTLNAQVEHDLLDRDLPSYVISNYICIWPRIECRSSMLGTPHTAHI